MNEDSRKYLERSAEALEAGRVLHREQLFLDAVSRAYYAMFHAALAALSTEAVSVKSHKGTINQFHRLFISTGKLPPDLGRMLSYAFEKRTSGDYEVSFVINEATSADIIDGAYRFLETVRTFLSETD